MEKIIYILIVGVLAVGCIQLPEISRLYTKEKAVETAKEFLANAPTYKWDGENMVVADVLTLRCPYCWSVVIEFQSRHGGYGDRTGKIVTQVITPHTARIVVREGKVISAVLDE
ncbi:MAG: hypothetical protein ABH874_03965, partial [Methanobacteriota archaeon]